MKLLGIAGNMGTGKDTVAELLRAKHGYLAVAFADSLKRLAAQLFLYDEPTLFGASELRNAPDPRATDDVYWAGVFRRATDATDAVTTLFDGRPSRLHPDVLMGALEGALVHLHGASVREGRLAPRYVLQYLGTEWGRSLWEKVWTNSARETVHAIEQGAAYGRFRGLYEDHQGEFARPRGYVVTDARFKDEIAEIKSWGGKAIWLDAALRVKSTHTHASEPRAEDFASIVDGVLYNNHDLPALEANLEYALKTLW